MHIVVLAEDRPGERRVALTPEAVGKLAGDGHLIVVEAGAGHGIAAGDDDYRAAGATIAGSRVDAIDDAHLIVAVNLEGAYELAGLDGRHTVVALLDPLWRPRHIALLAATGATALALEFVPRISRAQRMDVLSSMSTVAGYQAALVAAQRLPRMLGMLITAAGTVLPARVVVLGAGVAGLQAIATARRLGAVVEGYDVRAAAAEQIESLGAKAIDLGPNDHNQGIEAAEDTGRDPEDADGYAKVLSEAEQTRRRDALAPYIAAADIVITTATVPASPAPLLITAAMVEAMRPGSLIVDLAATRGGNCSVTLADEEVEHAGVTVIGPTQLESGAARTAGQMFANNLVALIRHLTGEDGRLVIDTDDEITSAMVVTRGGSVTHPRVADALETHGNDPVAAGIGGLRS